MSWISPSHVQCCLFLFVLDSFPGGMKTRWPCFPWGNCHLFCGMAFCKTYTLPAASMFGARPLSTRKFVHFRFWWTSLHVPRYLVIGIQILGRTPKGCATGSPRFGLLPFFGGGFPTKIDYRTKLVPCSNLSAGGPRQKRYVLEPLFEKRCWGPVLFEQASSV